jgi:hypothetical protein
MTTPLLIALIAWQDVVVGLFPSRIATFSRALAAQKSQLLAYLIAARLTPVVPSWFINLASPILQVLFALLLSALIPLLHRTDP